MWFFCRVFALVALLSVAGVCHSDGGRVEINQASVVEAGGFPHVISTPGNFVLTSDLVVGSDVDALHFNVGPVSLDLNGFEIVGTASCDASSCATGSASGVSTRNSVAVRVQGGGVRKFSGSCVELGSGSFAKELSVSECGKNGIQIFQDGHAFSNHVSSVADSGIVAPGISVHGHNVVTNTDLSSTGSRAIVGGTATAGSHCEDGSCARRPQRRYYLTTTLQNGAQTLQACEPGFHMASLHEISDWSSVIYDVSRGHTIADSGNGPPADLTLASGWIRTGGIAVTSPGGSDPLAVKSNCNAWTETVGSGVLAFAPIAQGDSSSAGEDFEWGITFTGCGAMIRTWCVED